jgi:DNA (cytosine-5)-methyltransferase 1
VAFLGVGVNLLSFTKAKRAQNVNDFESWISGGVAPTLNAMDNNGEAYATVLIVAVDGYNQTISNVNQTLRVGSDLDKMGMVLIIDGTRVDDVRVYEDGIVPTVISRYGTGGGNVPMIFSHTQGLDAQPSETNSPTLRTGGSGMAVAYSVREDAKANNFSATETETSLTLQGHLPSPQSHHAQLFLAETSTVRRLTPVECERLQGFPDDWTSGQADSNRYKQMGNAVAVPVVEWIISRMVGNDE